MASALGLNVLYTTGAALKAIPRKWTAETSTLGDWWNDTTSAFVASDPGSSAYLSLTEVSGAGVYLYGRSTGLASYTGKLVILYIVGSTYVGSEVVDMINGFVSTRLETLAADWANGGRLDTLLDTAAAGGTVADPISPHVVSVARTWLPAAHGDSVVARNTVTIGAGAVCTLSMDFSRVLNGSQGGVPTSISTVTSVTDTSGSPRLTFSDTLVSQDRRCVHFTLDDVSDVIAGNKATIRVEVVTTDSQSLVAYGRLAVVGG